MSCRIGIRKISTKLLMRSSVTEHLTFYHPQKFSASLVHFNADLIVMCEIAQKWEHILSRTQVVKSYCFSEKPEIMMA